MNLLIDIGNTRLKWASSQNQQLTTGPALVNTQLNQQQLWRYWQHLPKPQRIGIATVSADHLLALVQSVAAQLWPGVQIIAAQAQANAFGVINAYQQPETLGVDRWLTLVAARHHYPAPAFIVDCGTAITIDLIDATGLHQGGLISPGLTLMKTALAKGTAQLPLTETSFSFGLANNTAAAIYSGTLAGAAGLIEYTYQQHRDSQLILTGGDATLIAEQLLSNAIIDADLVLRGLAIVLQGST
ncbi:MAG: type III pantothenate kinase [Methylococcales bacterium]